MAKETVCIRATLPKVVKEYIEKNKYLDCAKVTIALWLKYVDDPSILDEMCNNQTAKMPLVPMGDIGDGVKCYGSDDESDYYVKLSDYRKLRDRLED
jgi:hypothetical protein